jgi:mevalonate kinase
MNTKKIINGGLNNFKPMIPEQFHAIWQKELTLTITI